MAAGDGFSNLLGMDDQEEAADIKDIPGATPLNREPGILEQSTSALKAQKGKATLGGPSGGPDPSSTQVMQDADEAAFWQGEDQALTKRRANERAGLTAGVKEQQADDLRRAELGTTDPVKAAQLKATGVFDPDFKARFQADPPGGAAAAAKAYAILGIGGVQDAPTGPPAPGRTYSVGVGTHGEPYYTNKTEGELFSEGAPVQNLGPGPTTNDALKALPYQDAPTPVGGTPSRDPADILFQGKLDRLREIVEQPARDAQTVKDTQAFKEKMFTLAQEKGADVAHQAITDFFGKDNLSVKAKQDVDKLIGHFGQYTAKQIKEKHLDPNQYFPYHKGPITPGAGNDLSQQATVENPGGRMNDTTFQLQRQQQVASQTTQQIDDQSAEEQPTAMHYAISDTAKKLKRNAAKEALAKAQLPSNPLLGRLESDRQQEIADAQRRVAESQ